MNLVIAAMTAVSLGLTAYTVHIDRLDLAAINAAGVVFWLITLILRARG